MKHRLTSIFEVKAPQMVVVKGVPKEKKQNSNHQVEIVDFAPFKPKELVFLFLR